MMDLGHARDEQLELLVVEDRERRRRDLRLVAERLCETADELPELLAHL